jgi:hypothetical protein
MKLFLTIWWFAFGTWLVVLSLPNHLNTHQWLYAVMDVIFAFILFMFALKSVEKRNDQWRKNAPKA